MKNDKGFLFQHKHSIFSIALIKLIKENKDFNPFKDGKSFDLLVKTANIIRYSINQNPKIKSLYNLKVEENAT